MVRVHLPGSAYLEVYYDYIVVEIYTILGVFQLEEINYLEQICSILTNGRNSLTQSFSLTRVEN